jgi:hypothetical protein
MRSDVAVRRWRALAACIPGRGRAAGTGGRQTVRPPGYSSSRQGITRLVRVAVTGGIGLAAAGGLAAVAAPAQAASWPAPRARCTL